MFNRVHVMILGVAVFVFFSAMCGLAQSDAWLIGSRALQGVGAALMIPPTATIVVNTFGVEERGKAMGIYAGISMIFLSLGPLIGGPVHRIARLALGLLDQPAGGPGDHRDGAVDEARRAASRPGSGSTGRGC